MLDLFLEWARKFQADLSSKAVKASVFEAPCSDNPSARIDIDTPTAVARITCWKSGDYDAEIIDIETERALYSTHGVFKAGRAIEEQVSPFLKALEGRRSN